jgi:Family of unknown function (DUF5991)
VLTLLVLGGDLRAQRAAGRRADAPARQVSDHPSPNRAAWEGTYTFQEGGGRTAGGTGMFVEHTIKVYQRDGGLIADLDAAGFQVSTSLRCVAKAAGDRLDLYFESYREENVTEPYRKGQLLLSLARSTYHGKARILTYWAAYRPAFRALRSGRVYFRKTG